MEERIIKIVKAAAHGPVGYDDRSTWCSFCNESDDWTATRQSEEHILIIHHQPGCPVLVARELLREWGMPLKVWRVEYEIRAQQAGKPDEYRPVTLYRSGFTQEEVMQEFTHEHYCNVRATFVREWIEVV